MPISLSVVLQCPALRSSSLVPATFQTTRAENLPSPLTGPHDIDKLFNPLTSVSAFFSMSDTQAYLSVVLGTEYDNICKLL